MITLGQRLRAAREHAGLTQAQVAARMGSSAPTISQTECDALKAPASLEWVHRYALAVGCPPSDLDERLTGTRIP